VSYDMGLGLSKDPAKAARWYRKAAEQGLADAQFSLGQMYAEGRGVRKDLVAAYKWLSLSAGAGSDRAHRALVALEYELTAREIDLAETLATEWLAARASEEAPDEEGSPATDPRRRSPRVP
jgi:hypothetical protein